MGQLGFSFRYTTNPYGNNKVELFHLKKTPLQSFQGRYNQNLILIGHKNVILLYKISFNFLKLIHFFSLAKEKNHLLSGLSVLPL